jgi:hypothetical protein
MEIIGRLYRAFNALTGRSKIGALQGGLIFNLKNSGVDSPRSQQFISRIAVAAWNMRVIAEFFQGLGFSFEDYELMYRAAVIACPNRLIQERNLVATFLMIDRCHEFRPGFQAIAEAVSGTAGATRASGLSTLIASTVNDIATSYPRGGFRD